MTKYLYLGDGDQWGAAAYLAGIMSFSNISFDHFGGGSPLDDDLLSRQYDGYILSDFPSACFKPGQMERIRDAVRNGAGLLMIGGWESFHGQNGEYQDSPIAEALPVKCLDRDDRLNLSQPIMLYRRQGHPILDGLAWNQPPFIGGFNEIEARPDSKTLLRAIRFDVRIIDEDQVADCNEVGICDVNGRAIEERLSIPLPSGEAAFLSIYKTYPMLVLGQFGSGRTAAFASDVAPHWVGGMVDWGAKRVVQNLSNNNSIEVGSEYIEFFARIIRWIGNELG